MTPIAGRGFVMTVVGVVMIGVAVVIALASADPLPATLAVVGLVFVAVGARQRSNEPKREGPATTRHWSTSELAPGPKAPPRRSSTSPSPT